jgi:hypothetical protein
LLSLARNPIWYVPVVAVIYVSALFLFDRIGR